MRIAMVNNSRETFTPTVSGAIGTWIWETARRASADGVRLHVVTQGTDAEPYPLPGTHFLPPARPARLPERGERAIRRITGWAHPTQQAHARTALTHLRSVRPDVVICHNDPEIAVFLADHLPGADVLHVFHNLEMARDSWRRRYAQSRVRSIAVSAYLARGIEQIYQMHPRSIPVVPGGVDLDAFSSGAGLGGVDREPGSSIAALPTLGYLGRVAVEKAPDTFLRACMELADQGQEFAVQLIGDTTWRGDDGSAYGQEIRDLVRTLSERGVEVHSPGHVPRAQLPALLSRAQVHVVPSRWDEPFGLTTLEGMAAGRAVVATAVGGTPEIVADAGMLVPRDDVRAMTDALARLLTEPRVLATYRELALQRAREFPWSRTWESLNQVIRDAL